MRVVGLNPGENALDGARRVANYAGGQTITTAFRAPKYRLLNKFDTIAQTDEILLDDCERWLTWSAPTLGKPSALTGPYDLPSKTT